MQQAKLKGMTSAGLDQPVINSACREGIPSRVVSMASWNILEHQSEAYQDSVLPRSHSSRIAVVQASTFG